MPNSASGTTNDKQNKSFVDSPTRGSDWTAREVFLGNSELVFGFDYDRIDISYPSSTTEVFVYSLNSVNIRTVRATYLTAAKKDLISVEIL